MRCIHTTLEVYKTYLTLTFVQLQCIHKPLLNEHIKGYKHKLYTVAFIILCRMHICIVYLWPWKYRRPIWPWPLHNCYIFIIFCERNILIGTNTNFILLDSWFSVESYAVLYIYHLEGIQGLFDLDLETISKHFNFNVFLTHCKTS